MKEHGFPVKACSGSESADMMYDLKGRDLTSPTTFESALHDFHLPFKITWRFYGDSLVTSLIQHVSYLWDSDL